MFVQIVGQENNRNYGIRYSSSLKSQSLYSKESVEAAPHQILDPQQNQRHGQGIAETEGMWYDDDHRVLPCQRRSKIRRHQCSGSNAQINYVKQLANIQAQLREQDWTNEASMHRAQKSYLARTEAGGPSQGATSRRRVVHWCCLPECLCE
jgi:hypothetical protein